MLLLLASVLLLAATSLAEAARWAPLADPLTSFRFHYLIAAAVFVALGIWRRARVASALAALVLVVNAAWVAPLYLDDARDAAPGSPRLRVAHLNAQSGSLTLDGLRSFLVEQRPDVMVILDPDTGWRDRVARADLPLDVVYPRRGQRGAARVLVLADVPVRDVGLAGEGLLPGGDSLPGSSVAMTIDSLGEPIRLLALHTHSPTSPSHLSTRDRQLRAAARWVRAQDLPVVVVGDLNATLWSHRLRAFLSETGLVDSERGHGYDASWPTILGPFGIPIDHALHDPSLTVVRRALGPSLGSEHHSLVVDVALADAR